MLTIIIVVTHLGFLGCEFARLNRVFNANAAGWAVGGELACVDGLAYDSCRPTERRLWPMWVDWYADVRCRSVNWLLGLKVRSCVDGSAYASFLGWEGGLGGSGVYSVAKLNPWLLLVLDAGTVFALGNVDRTRIGLVAMIKFDVGLGVVWVRPWCWHTMLG